MNGEGEEKAEAGRLRELAETKFRDSNLKSALKYAKRAHRLDPNLDGAAEILTSFHILRVAADSSDDWYRILQVEPFAHTNTIKKQYKKLALLLHPDKNPYAGSEEAFKLVGEAFRFLSDKIRRKEYDLKLRIRIQNQKMISDAESETTFWTACSTCRLLHQFEKRYVGHNLVCPSCRKSFKAVEVVHNEPEIRENGRRLRNLSSRLNSGSFQGLEQSSYNRKKVSTTSQSKKTSSSVKENGLELNGKAVSVRNGDLEEEVDSSESDDEIWSRRRLRSGSMRIRKKMTSVGDVLERSNSKLKPTVKMEEEMITLAELQSQVIQKARKHKTNKLKLKQEEAEERENKRKKKGVEEDDDTDSETLTLKEMESLLRIRRQGASNKTGFLENAKQRNLKKHMNLVHKSNGGDLDMMKVEDSDFYDFDKDRMETSFKKGQVWAIYDDDDGMPRHYGLIEEVTVNPFEVKMSWLDIQNNGDARLLSWEKMGFHVSCGSFKVSKKTTIHSLNIFSHVVGCERAAREVYRIYPKKESVWALYKEEEASDAEKRNGSKRTYDIAVFLTTYNEMHGLSMAYLEKVDGYKTIFKRREIGYHAIRWFGKDDIRLFSHQIPARKLSVDEALGHLKDCWELDPASLSSDLLTNCWSR